MRYRNEEEFRQAVLRARAMSPEEKLLAGERLFAEECEQMRAEIRREMPGCCEEFVKLELRARLNHRREQEEREIYIPSPLGWKPQP